MSKTAITPGAPSAVQTDQLICACEELTRAAMNDVLKGNPGISFEDFLSQTKAGQTCTACLLDIEYEFVTFTTSSAAATVAPAGTTRRQRETLPLKQRLYRLLDRISPKTPATITDVIPILAAPEYQQNLIVTNQPLLFGDTFIAPDFEVALEIRTADGREVSNTTRLLRSGETWREDLSAPIAAAAGQQPRAGAAAFTLGSALIRRRARRSGFRGTTRPQTEIIGPGGVSAVHLQGASFNGGGGVVFDGRPETRRFVSFVSLDKEPIEIEVTYPLPLGEDTPAGSNHKSERLRLGPKATAIVEIPGELASSGSAPGSPLIRVEWIGRGIYKAHGYNADSDLTRMAIDHL